MQHVVAGAVVHERRVDVGDDFERVDLGLGVRERGHKREDARVGTHVQHDLRTTCDAGEELEREPVRRPGPPPRPQ